MKYHVFLIIYVANTCCHVKNRYLRVLIVRHFYYWILIASGLFINKMICPHSAVVASSIWQQQQYIWNLRSTSILFAVRMFNCSSMATNCGGCRRTDPAYECGWYPKEKRCCVKRECLSASWTSSKDICSDPKILSVSKQCKNNSACVCPKDCLEVVQLN